jgi:ligand-binding sensor domain-containing protein
MLQRFLFLILFISLTLTSSGQNELGGIGQWREHYNNRSVTQLGIAKNTNGDKKIIGATTQQVFSITAKNKVTLLGKSTGLHDISIACSAWDDAQSQLIIAYNNSNIDIVKGDQVYAITDLLLSNLYPSKKINHIYLLNQWALVSTDFGIVVIDLIKHEIKDTWFPNNNRQVTKTFQIVSTQDVLYVATENGIWTCPLKNNWISGNQWQNNSDFNNLGINKISQYNNIVYSANANSIYQLPVIIPYFNLNTGQIKKIVINKDGLYTSFSNGNKGGLLKVNTDKTSTSILDSLYLSNPVDYLFDENNIWLADSINGLLLKNTSTNWIPLGGPAGNINGQIFINTKYLIAPFGGADAGFSIYNEEGWKNFNRISNKNLPICYSSAADPIDGSIWLTSSDGLLKFNNDKGTIEQASPASFKGFFSNIQFSSDGTLWTLLEGQGILQRQNNIWKLITPPNTLSLDGINKMFINQQGQEWMIAPKYQGIMVYNPNATGEKWSIINTYNNNLPSSTVTSMIDDKNGTMWVGTNNGIGLFDCNEISTCKAYLPQIKNNNGFAGLLFQKENVNCIIADGANRKWVGTNNGTWLLSTDGTEIIERFTKNNSPLPNDTIRQIIIAPSTGEVFFNTAQQMASYRSTATSGTTPMQQINIFPNPISPNYNGPIAMRGLAENAIVKITSLSGKLVYQTRALGGQAIWNGKTYDGNKVATGVYLVFARDELGTEKAVGKIMITHGQ